MTGAPDIPLAAQSGEGPGANQQYRDWCTWLTRDTVVQATDHHREIFELD